MTLGNEEIDALYVHFHLSVNCGTQCLYSQVDTLIVPTENVMYPKHTFFLHKHHDIKNHSNYPSKSFINNLTFNEAYALAKSIDYEIIEWRGKLYRIE